MLFLPDRRLTVLEDDTIEEYWWQQTFRMILEVDDKINMWVTVMMKMTTMTTVILFTGQEHFLL